MGLLFSKAYFRIHNANTLFRYILYSIYCNYDTKLNISLLSVVISNSFWNDNFRIFLRFQTDHDRKVNCSYSGITCMTVHNLLFANLLYSWAQLIYCSINVEHNPIIYNRQNSPGSSFRVNIFTFKFKDVYWRYHPIHLCIYVDYNLSNKINEPLNSEDKQTINTFVIHEVAG
jgi:hypothetical protein